MIRTHESLFPHAVTEESAARNDDPDEEDLLIKKSICSFPETQSLSGMEMSASLGFTPNEAEAKTASLMTNGVTNLSEPTLSVQTAIRRAGEF
jgi:hypothetical protein